MMVNVGGKLRTGMEKSASKMAIICGEESIENQVVAVNGDTQLVSVEMFWLVSFGVN